MFKGTRDIMVKSTKPMPEVVKTIEECGHFIGTVSVTDSGNISSSASRFDGFGYVPEISGSIFEKGKGKYFISINHNTKIGVFAWILAICFFPIGLLAFLPAYNGNQTMISKCDQLLNEVKYSLEKGG